MFCYGTICLSQFLFQASIVKAAAINCVCKVIGASCGNHPQTLLWTPQVEEAVKLKKSYQELLGGRSQGRGVSLAQAICSPGCCWAKGSDVGGVQWGSKKILANHNSWGGQNNTLPTKDWTMNRCSFSCIADYVLVSCDELCFFYFITLTYVHKLRPVAERRELLNKFMNVCFLPNVSLGQLKTMPTGIMNMCFIITSQKFEF